MAAGIMSWAGENGQQLDNAVARCSVNYCATSRHDSTIIAPVSVYHHVSYTERDSRSKQRLINSLEAEVDESAGLMHEPQGPPPYKISRFHRESLSNDMARSALFSCIQGKDRRFIKDALLAAVEGKEIRFTGEQLNQDDHDLLMQMVFMGFCSGYV